MRKLSGRDHRDLCVCVYVCRCGCDSGLCWSQLLGEACAVCRSGREGGPPWLGQFVRCTIDNWQSAHWQTLPLATVTRAHTHTQLGGAVTGPVNLGALLRKRVTHIFSTLRSRSLEYREKLIQEVRLAATVITVHKESASFIKIVVNHEKKKKRHLCFYFLPAVLLSRTPPLLQWVSEGTSGQHLPSGGGRSSTHQDEQQQKHRQNPPHTLINVYIVLNTCIYCLCIVYIRMMFDNTFSLFIVKIVTIETKRLACLPSSKRKLQYFDSVQSYIVCT